MVSQKIKMLIYGSAVWHFGEGMLGPLFAVFAERVGGDIFDITWAWAIYLIVTGIMVMIVGKIANDKKRRDRLMTAGYALNALFTFGYLLVRSPIHLFIVQAGLGLAIALTSPTWTSMFSTHGNYSRKAYEWGLADGIANILMAAGIIAGGFIVNYISFDALFITMGIVQTIALVYQLKLVRG